MLTLSTLQNVLAEFETRFGKKPLDTHFFASSSGINTLTLLCEKPSRLGKPTVEILQLRSLAGMDIWHDPDVPPHQIEVGRIGIRDGKPYKIVTKTFDIDAA